MEQYQAGQGLHCDPPDNPERFLHKRLAVWEHQDEHFGTPPKRACTPENRFQGSHTDPAEQEADQEPLESEWLSVLNQQLLTIPQQPDVKYSTDWFGFSEPQNLFRGSDSTERLLDQVMDEGTSSNLYIDGGTSIPGVFDSHQTPVNECVPAYLEDYHSIPDSPVNDDHFSVLNSLGADLNSVEKCTSDLASTIQQKMNIGTDKAFSSQVTLSSHVQHNIESQSSYSVGPTPSDICGTNGPTPSSGHEQSSHTLDDSSPIDGSSSPSLKSTATKLNTFETEQVLTSYSGGNKYDTCFGLIHMRQFVIKDSFLEDKHVREFCLDIYGDTVIIRDSRSKEYAGYLHTVAAQVIATLSSLYRTSFSATLRSSENLSVIVYGFRNDSDGIGDFLIDHNYFLQQPHNFDLSTTYYNPQYLIRPSSEFQASWESLALNSVQSSRLGGKLKSKIAQVLDSATGPTSFSEVQVSNKLKTGLLLHQKKALAMMAEKESGRLVGLEFPPVWTESNETGYRGMKIYRNSVTGALQSWKPELCLGGLLADDMGLGKTLTVLALIAGSLDESTAEVEEAKLATLIIVPLSTLSSWENQIQTHFRNGSLGYTIYHGSARPKDAAFLTKYPIVLTTYDMLKADYREHSSRAGLLHGICWHRIILDEAHIIRNQSSQVFQSVRNLSAKHRWCITATPIQNRVEDLGGLVEFLRVWPFDSPWIFRQNFVIPVNNGDNTGWQRLRSLVGAISLRRTKDAIDLTLPTREEIIHPVTLDTNEDRIYKLFIRSCVSAIETRESARSCLQNILKLRQICNHGRDLLPADTRRWLDSVLSTDDDSIDPGQYCENCNGTIQDSDGETDEFLGCFHQICKACLEAAQDGDNLGEPICPLCSESDCGDKKDGSECGIDTRSSYRPSSKVKALLENLQKNSALPLQPGEMPIKSVIFSAWTKMLDLVEKALGTVGLQFQRIDGSKNFQSRNHALHNFRTDPSCTILLATLGSAGVGLDLTAASQVHLLEPGWNPMLERQALDRVHRIGQTRNVLAICYVVKGPASIEEYIRRKQTWKLNLISTSLNESTTGRATAVKDMLGDLRKTLRSSL